MQKEELGALGESDWNIGKPDTYPVTAGKAMVMNTDRENDRGSSRACPKRIMTLQV
jgi:hypothetical protein